MSQPTPGPCGMCHADTGNHPAGTVFQQKPCGCSVAGIGLLPNPWHIHYCPLHARALAMRDLLQELHDAVYLWPLGADGYHETWMKARALLKEIE